MYLSDLLNQCARILLTVGMFAAAGSARGDIVYVASKSSGKLLRFDTAANPMAVETLSPTLYQPAALAFGADGNLYVAEWGNSGNSNTPQVRRYSPATNQISLVAELPGSKPSAIAFTPDGKMLVGRTGAGQMVGNDGWNQGSVAISSFGPSLNGSTGIAVAPDGSVYVSNMSLAPSGFGYDIASGPVVRLTSGGTFDREIVPDGSETGGLSGPTGVVLSAGALFTASVMNGLIFKTTGLDSSPSTEPFGALADSYLSSPGSLISLTDGSFLAGSAFPSNNSIYQVSSAGSNLATIINSNFGQVGGLAAVPEPSAWALITVAALTLASHRFRSSQRQA